MDSAHTERLLENAERRTVVLERICQQQEVEITSQRSAYNSMRIDMSRVQRVNDEFVRWHNQTTWQKVKHILGF